MFELKQKAIKVARWLGEHTDNPDLADVTIRLDNISMLVAGEDCALLRHNINCLGNDLASRQGRHPALQAHRPGSEVHARRRWQTIEALRARCRALTFRWRAPGSCSGLTGPK